MSTPHSIPIIGAGLTGLTLSLALKRLGIASTIYTHGPSPPRNNHGITLHAHSYRPLLPLLRLSEHEFRCAVSVDGPIFGGNGYIPGVSDSFRCNRGRLERLLREQGLDVRRGRTLVGITTSLEEESTTRPVAVFKEDDDGKEGSGADASWQKNSTLRTPLIATEGPHSRARSSLLPDLQLNVLPYVVYSGKRYVSENEYWATYEPLLRDGVFLETHVRLRSGQGGGGGVVRVELGVNDVSDHGVAVGWVFSRPVRADGDGDGAGDKLWRRDRGVGGAGKIPQEFFDEVRGLVEHGEMIDGSEKLQSLLKTVFDADKLRNDRILHWLMRTVKPEDSVVAAARKQGVLLLGDAVHATPILGGEGANLGVRDGVALAEWIADKGMEDLGGFAAERLQGWRNAVEESVERIERMHTLETPNL